MYQYHCYVQCNVKESRGINYATIMLSLPGIRFARNNRCEMQSLLSLETDIIRLYKRNMFLRPVKMRSTRKQSF